MIDNEIEIEYCKEVILFFQNIQWLYNGAVIRILTAGSLDLFPVHWLDSLKKLKTCELNHFVVTGNVQVNSFIKINVHQTSFSLN